MKAISGRLAPLLLAMMLSACGGGDSNPLTASEKELIGTWRLDMPAVTANEFAFQYTFFRDRTVRNRMGGSLLDRVRDLPAMANANLGQLGDLDEIDGATVTWRGTWSVQGDSLHVLFDQLQVHALGDVPVAGSVSVPLFDARLTAAQQTRIAYSYAVGDNRLTLRGAAASAGVADDQAASRTANLTPLVKGALQVTTDVVLESYQNSNANEFVYIR